MKMKMIPTGNYLLVDVWEDLAERYVNIAYPSGRPKLPDGKNLPTGLVGMQNFTASYELQQRLLDEVITGYYTNLEGIQKIPRGFWRDKTGNDSIWSGMIPSTLSTESEWIFVNRTDYAELLARLGMADVLGSGLVRENQEKAAEPSTRRPMSATDIEAAIEGLRQKC
ncbi:hypothetical protein MKK84_00680 [Methylobacterium sp. E-065]|uniref:hypothetical protein n=1 Tax=Methylobacterium sp. E-065 TaxID=2836583 RepID=UPI001FBAFE62|nr:hypothetical protein [Methylobacterium sp. E-065]MCJ2015955.1 hypothetical protein [Methylobacterium sp. E-065]